MANSLAPPNLYVDTTATAYTGKGWLQAATLRNGHTAAQQLLVYDNTSAADQILIDVELAADTSLQLAWGTGFNGKPFDIGLHVVIPANTFVCELTLG